MTATRAPQRVVCDAKPLLSLSCKPDAKQHVPDRIQQISIAATVDILEDKWTHSDAH